MEHVLNVGCGKGYQAIRLARRMPNSVVKPYDLSKGRRALCSNAAKENGVDERVSTGAQSDAEKLTALTGHRVFVV